MTACLRAAEALATKAYSEKLPLLLESEAHLTDHEPAQSLIFSWAIIEEVITQKWDAFIPRKKVTGGRRQQLRSTREWPVQARLDAMEELLVAFPGLWLTGSAYRGIGIPDCIHQGTQTAKRLLAALAPVR